MGASCAKADSQNDTKTKTDKKNDNESQIIELSNLNIPEPANGVIPFSEYIADLPYSYVIYALAISIARVLEDRKQHKNQYETVEIHFTNEVIQMKWSVIAFQTSKISQEVKRQSNGLVITASSTLSGQSLFVTFVMNLGSIIYINKQNLDDIVYQIKQQMYPDTHYHVIWFNEQKVNQDILEDFMQNGISKISNERAFLHANTKTQIQIVTFRPGKLCVEQFCSPSALYFLKSVKQMRFDEEIYVSYYNLYPSHIQFLVPLYNIFLNKDSEKYIMKIEYCYIAQNLVVKTVKATPIYKYINDYFGKQQANFEYYKQTDFLANYKSFLLSINGPETDVDEDMEHISVQQIPTKSSIIKEEPIETQNTYELDQINDQEVEIEVETTKKKKKAKKQKKNRAPQLEIEKVISEPTISQTVVTLAQDQIVNDYMFNTRDEILYNLYSYYYYYLHEHIRTQDAELNQANVDFLVQNIYQQLNEGDTATSMNDGGQVYIVIARKYQRGF